MSKTGKQQDWKKVNSELFEAFLWYSVVKVHGDLSLTYKLFGLAKTGVEVVMRCTAQIQITIGFIDLIVGDSDVIQSNRDGGVVQHLREKQELPRVVVTHYHLVEGEGLPESVSRHLDVQVKIVCDSFQDPIDGFPIQRFVAVLSSVGFTSEHIVTEGNSRCMLQIQDHCIDDCCVDGDVSVLFLLPCVSGLLFEDWETILKGEVVIDQIGEPKHSEITDSKSKVNTNNEQHIVTVAFILDQVVGDPHDVIHRLDWFGSMLRSQHVFGSLFSRSDQSSAEFDSILLDRCEVYDLSISEIVSDDSF